LILLELRGNTFSVLLIEVVTARGFGRPKRNEKSPAARLSHDSFSLFSEYQVEQEIVQTFLPSFPPTLLS